MGSVAGTGGILTVLLLICGYGLAFPTGAPYKSCANLYPKHSGSQAQLSESPYNITFNPSTYSPGDNITVTLKANNGNHTFKGFQLRARRTTGNTEELVGDFTPVSPNIAKRFWYPQDDSYTNCLTHGSRDEKTEVVVIWRAPPVISLGNVIFRATFVKDYRTFWVDVESAPLVGNQPNPNSTVDSAVSGNFGNLVLDGACGNSKGCLYFPTFCTGSNCNYVVTYQVLSATKEATFEIKAKTTGYFTLALSDDKTMGDDEAVTCINKDSFVSVQYGFNPAYYNDRHSIKGFRDISTKNENGYIYCRFTRPIVRSLTHIVMNGSIPQKKIYTFDLNKPYYIFLAYGDLYQGADVLSKHVERPLVSQYKVDLSKNIIVRANSLPIETKCHAALMMFAWMLFAMITSTAGRYMKDGFNGAMCMGIKAWFHLHRACACMTAACTVAAFILIFVYLKKWTTNGTIHAGFGIALTSIMLIQILGGMLRPDLNHPLRGLFRNGHSLTACISLLVSATTLMLAARMPLLNDQLRLWLTISTAVWIGVDILFALAFETINTQKMKIKARVEDESIMMKQPVTTSLRTSKSQLTLTTRDHEDELQKLQTGLHVTYGIYIFVMFAFTAINVVFIFLF